MLKGLNTIGGKSRVVPTPSKESEKIIREEVQQADLEIHETDKLIDSAPPIPAVREPEEQNISDESTKLSKLVEDDFPFDDSQLDAVSGMIQQRYACMFGAAGTGKTTVTKKLVDLLQNSAYLTQIDVSTYWQRGAPDDDDYEIPSNYIPSVVMCSFTGRSTQMTKKNFPQDWHPNIMTIHRMLGFYPEFYEDMDEETGNLVNKRRFVPAYNADNKLPWDIIIIDECGMLGLELWHQLWAAAKPGCRIYMIGDIQQLPPTHGKSIFGFALAKWPTWELTHIHRQQGANNSIVDNAHRILNGRRPESDSEMPLAIKNGDDKSMLAALKFMIKDKDWRFLTVDVDEDHRIASIKIRQALKLLQGKIYEPNRDVVITPINGFEMTQPGYTLGQAQMNQQLVPMLNHDAIRYIIDGGREKRNFAVGDKVMATINDYEAGITNGMTGIIVSIEEHSSYMGDSNRFGKVEDVNAYFEGLDEDFEEDIEFDMDEMLSDSSAGMEELKRQKEKKDAGPASHIVTVRFGDEEHGFERVFSTKAQVASLILAYVATCHKMQGGEAPLVFVICHQSTKMPLNREWLYTAVTRASMRCVLFQTRQGVGIALGKQSVKGKTVDQKIENFRNWMKIGPAGPDVRVKIPNPKGLNDEETEQSKELAPVDSRREVAAEESKTGGEIAAREESPPQKNIRGEDIREAPSAEERHRIIHETVIRTVVEKRAEPAEVWVDGGELNPEPKPKNWNEAVRQLVGPTHALPSPARTVSQWGAIHMKMHLDAAKDGPLLLTHQPPAEPKKPINSLLAKLKATGQTATQIAEQTVKDIDGPLPEKPVNRLANLLAKQRIK